MNPRAITQTIFMAALAMPSLVRAPAMRTDYQWTREKDTAAFEGSYNFPVFVVRGEMWAFHPRGGWSSRDGKKWVRSELPASGCATWREGSAPWSPRGAPAVWVFDGKLFMAGGKYSVRENGEQRFIYRNDVWSMSRAR